MKKNCDKILNEVFKKIEPSDREKKKILNVVDIVVEKTHSLLNLFGADSLVVAGSVVRDTWLSDKKEFDLFILFPKNLSRDKLEERGLKLGKRIIKELGGEYTVEYAEHPYVAGEVKGIHVDIVPCYKIENTKELKSSVDRTPFHVEFLKKYYPSKLSKEVRLLKKFMKAINVYGADAKTQGFSGYSTELLIIKYGGFLKTLEAAVNWKLGEVIDIRRFYKKEEYHNLRKKFKHHAMILIDPTDKNRNVLAALSIYNFFKFKKYSKKFLENPSKSFFFPKKEKPLTVNEFNKIIKERRTKLLLIKFKAPKVVPDILWPQLRKFAERLKNILEERKYEFKVFGKDVYTDEKKVAMVLLELEVYSLPKIQKRIGPIAFDFRGSRNFIEKYKDVLAGPYIEGINWIVEIKRKFLTAKEKIIDSLSDKKDILLKKGIPSYIASEISKRFYVFEEKEIKRLIKRDAGFAVFLKRYFKKERLV